MGGFKRLNRAKARKCAALAAAFEAPVFEPGEWRGKLGDMPRIDYTREVSDLHQLAYDAGLVRSFDWPAWQNECTRIEADPALLAVADLETIRRIITTWVRRERFAEGSLGAWVRQGGAARTLRRLGELLAAKE